MNNQETPPEFKDKYQLIFVGEFWSDDPRYKIWTEGRIEIRTWDDEYCNDEIRYCTQKNNEWFAFEKKYNCKWLTVKDLQELKNTVKEKFRRKPERE